MHNSVRELEGNLEDISLNQQYANDGIYLLCRRARAAARAASPLPSMRPLLHTVSSPCPAMFRTCRRLP